MRVARRLTVPCLLVAALAAAPSAAAQDGPPQTGFEARNRLGAVQPVDGRRVTDC